MKKNSYFKSLKKKRKVRKYKIPDHAMKDRIYENSHIKK